VWTGLRGGLVILVLGLAAPCSGCGGTEESAGLPLRDDFSDCSAGWSSDEDEFVSLSCDGGAYRVLIKDPRPQTARIFLEKGVPTLSVEADATRKAGPEAGGLDSFLVYGVGCWRTKSDGYVFLMSPDGAWGIEKATKGDSTPTTLAESESANAIPGLAPTNRIRAVCVGGGQKPTRLALYLNGEEVGSAEDAGGLDSFTGLGFTVLTNERGADVRFDNLVARETTPAQARDRAADGTSEPKGSALCKRAGVRYSGTTAQAAEVCFTLTPDGGTLIESGYGFVEASGCPDGLTGTDHNYYRGKVDASGGVRNSHGFVATIHGATASGTFEDPEICPGKKFAWRARRQR